MGKTFEMSFPAKENKKVTVMNLLIEVADAICEDYCKYPADLRSGAEGPGRGGRPAV